MKTRKTVDCIADFNLEITKLNNQIKKIEKTNKNLLKDIRKLNLFSKKDKEQIVFLNELLDKKDKELEFASQGLGEKNEN